MTAGAFDAELAAMALASTHVVEVNGRVQASLADLLSRLEPLLGTWQGGAATSFHVLKQRWHESATELNAALLSIGERLAQAGTTYATADDTNRTGFAGLTGGLGSPR
jgi:WXG100 family type VII secretion target